MASRQLLLPELRTEEAVTPWFYTSATRLHFILDNFTGGSPEFVLEQASKDLTATATMHTVDMALDSADTFSVIVHDQFPEIPAYDPWTERVRCPITSTTPLRVRLPLNSASCGYSLYVLEGLGVYEA